jgi:hypothetical protein
MSESDTEYPNVSYSREATIAAIADFYTFLTHMYLNESEVIYPPAEGWPSIVNADPATLKDLSKSDEVLYLLAHLPYIRRDCDEGVEVIPWNPLEDWSYLFDVYDRGVGMGEAMRELTEGQPLASLSLPHIFGLAHINHESSPIIILDTELGIIQWDYYTCPDEIGEERAWNDWDERKKDLLDVDDLDGLVSQEEAKRRSSAPVWDIPDFFEALKYKFRNLNWVPISPYSVRCKESWDEAGMMSMLKDIYRQHAWPDLAVYRKTECLEAVRKALVENYPDAACYRE